MAQRIYIDGSERRKAVADAVRAVALPQRESITRPSDSFTPQVSGR